MLCKKFDMLCKIRQHMNCNVFFRYHVAHRGGICGIYDVQCEREFLSLFVHGSKTGESRNSLQVANLALRSQPWLAIFCKAPPPRTNEKLFNEHRKEMIRVVDLQGTHGLA